MVDPIKKRAKAHTRYYLDDGAEVPGVTTVLNLLGNNKDVLMNWAWKLGMEGINYRTYRDETAVVGTLAHYLAQCDLAGVESDTSMYSPQQINDAENALIKFYGWRKENIVVPIFTEKPLVSHKYGYGGTIDLYANLQQGDGEVRALVDYKTGSGVYLEHICQTAAYENLLIENKYPVDDRRLLRIGRDETEGFEQHVLGRAELEPYFEIFVHMLGVYRAIQRINQAKKRGRRVA